MQSSVSTTTTQSKTVQTTAPSVVSSRSSTTTVKIRGTVPTIIASRPPRLVAQAEKNAAAQAAASVRTAVPSHSLSSTTLSTTSRINTTKLVTTTIATQTFAAKLSEATVNQLAISVNTTTKSRNLVLPTSNAGPISPQSITVNIHSSPKHSRPTPTASAPPNMQHYQNHSSSGVKANVFPNQANVSVPISEPTSSNVRSSTPLPDEPGVLTQSEYSLFQPMWRRDNESQKPVNFAAVTGGSTSQNPVGQNKFIDQEPPQIVDLSKAPGYRGGTVCSPVSSKTSSNSTTPPNSVASNASFQVSK